MLLKKIFGLLQLSFVVLSEISWVIIQLFTSTSLRRHLMGQKEVVNNSPCWPNLLGEKQLN